MNTDHDLIIDLNALRSAQSIMQGKFVKILNYYFEDTETYLDSIRKGIEQNDMALIIPAAHTIKSSSKQLGADLLANTAAELENLGKQIMIGQNKEVDLRHFIEDLDTLYIQTKNQLETAVKEIF